VEQRLWAAPIIFTSSTFDAGAVAIAGSEINASFEIMVPPSGLPLVPSATALSGDNSATATGIADDSFLAATSDVTSIDEETVGVGTSGFTGLFTAPGGSVRFTFGFETVNDASGSGFAEGLFAFSVAGGGLTLLDETIIANGTIERVLDIPAGTLGVLTLLLTSTATADATGGSAFNVTGATFQADVVSATVPETRTLLLIMLGLAVLFALRRAAILGQATR